MWYIVMAGLWIGTILGVCLKFIAGLILCEVLMHANYHLILRNQSTLLGLLMALNLFTTHSLNHYIDACADFRWH